MTAQLLQGKVIAESILEKTRKRLLLGDNSYKLGIVLVGNNPASEIYIRMKTRKCDDLGIAYEVFTYDFDISEERLIEEIEKLNTNNDVTSVIIQLPLPKQIDERKVVNTLNPNKDVDGLTAFNLGKLFEGTPSILPATPKAVLKIIESTGVDITGYSAVVIGRSNLVGKPVGQLLLNKNTTVTLCHSHTKNLSKYTKEADIIVSAVGNKHFITSDMVKEGLIAIDVGITREDKKLYGDLHPDIEEKAAYFTPVPGGVGPVTIACLIDNIVR